jgi:hypothetical protein
MERPSRRAQSYDLVDCDEGVNDPSVGLSDAVTGARVAAASVIGLGEVEQALARVDAKVVESWLRARQLGFNLTADDLVGLTDSGVPDGGVDVMVTLSFPSKLIVGPSAPTEEVEPVSIVPRISRVPRIQSARTLRVPVRPHTATSDTARTSMGSPATTSMGIIATDPSLITRGSTPIGSDIGQGRS